MTIESFSVNILQSARTWGLVTCKGKQWCALLDCTHPEAEAVMEIADKLGMSGPEYRYAESFITSGATMSVPHDDSCVPSSPALAATTVIVSSPKPSGPSGSFGLGPEASPAKDQSAP